MTDKSAGIAMEVITDPKEVAKAKARSDQFQRNWAWFQVYTEEIYQAHRGKCLCVSGAELFVADTPDEALALAKAAHPEDDGRFTYYVHREKAARIYAH